MHTDQQPRIPYWHLWTDADGVSRQTRCVLTEFELQSIAKPAQPQWQGHRTRAEVTVMMTVLPVGWTGEWHENPKPQWILPLSGRWFVESMDGQRVEMGPGEISFGADQNAREAGGRKGHLSGVVGDEPAVLLLIQFENAQAGPSPCMFR
jgi:hypothetical protein